MRQYASLTAKSARIPRLRGGGSRLSCHLGLFHRSRRFEIFVVPRQIPLIAIPDVAGTLNPVELVGVDDELGLATKGAEGLVHLLAALDRHIEVTLTAQEQGRGLDAVGVEERVGDFDVCFPGFRFPGWTDLVVVLD